MSLLAALWGFFARVLAFFRGSPDSLPSPVTSTGPLFHPPQGPFPHISVSGILASAEPTPAPAPTPKSPSDHSTASLSDASWQVVPLQPDTLPSPWSPVGRLTPPDVWMSIDGVLMNAAGPVDDHAQEGTPQSLSRISSASFYSTDTVFVNPVTVPQLVALRDTKTPLKRRQTLSSVMRSQATSRKSHRATKSLSTPLSKLVHVDTHSPSSMSSMVYELRMALLADGKNLENIISLLDPEPTLSVEAI